MNFIRKHKFTTFTIITLIIIIVLVVALVRFLLPNYDGDIYGNRLNGISSYKIDDKKIDEMKSNVKTLEGVVSIDYILEGRLIDITISVNDEVEKDVAKGYADQAITHFTEEQKNYYDIQIFVTSDNSDSEKYPVIGYKHKTSGSLVWSNN